MKESHIYKRFYDGKECLMDVEIEEVCIIIVWDEDGGSKGLGEYVLTATNIELLKIPEYPAGWAFRSPDLGAVFAAAAALHFGIVSH